MDAAYTTKEDLGRRLCPDARPRVRRAAATVAAPAQRALDALARELITRSLMVLSVPGRILALGAALDDPYPESLRELTNTELAALVARFEVQPPATEDWSVFEQRMRYIVHLFRCFQEQATSSTRRSRPRRWSGCWPGLFRTGSSEVLVEEAQDPPPRVLG